MSASGQNITFAYYAEDVAVETSPLSKQESRLKSFSSSSRPEFNATSLMFPVEYLCVSAASHLRPLSSG